MLLVGGYFAVVDESPKGSGGRNALRGALLFSVFAAMWTGWLAILVVVPGDAPD